MTRETITLDRALLYEALELLLDRNSGPSEIGYAAGTLQAAALLAISAPATASADLPEGWESRFRAALERCQRPCAPWCRATEDDDRLDPSAYGG